MSKRRIVQAIAAAVATLLVIAFVSWLIGRQPAEQLAPLEDDAPLVELETPDAPDEAILYFAGRYNRLYAERRTLSRSASGPAKLELVMTELLGGPSTDDLATTLPPDLELGGVFLDSNGLLFVDLSSKAGQLRGMGSTDELLAVYSLVNTALANQPGARAVVLLWNGRQNPSLAGHVDTGRPLKANSRLIASSS